MAQVCEPWAVSDISSSSQRMTFQLMPCLFDSSPPPRKTNQCPLKNRKVGRRSGFLLKWSLFGGRSFIFGAVSLNPMLEKWCFESPWHFFFHSKFHPFPDWGTRYPWNIPQVYNVFMKWSKNSIDLAVFGVFMFSFLLFESCMNYPYDTVDGSEIRLQTTWDVWNSKKYGINYKLHSGNQT